MSKKQKNEPSKPPEPQRLPEGPLKEIAQRIAAEPAIVREALTGYFMRNVFGVVVVDENLKVLGYRTGCDRYVPGKELFVWYQTLCAEPVDPSVLAGRSRMEVFRVEPRDGAPAHVDHIGTEDGWSQV